MFKILDEVCKPTKGSKYSAAIDLYSAEDIVIGVGETVKVPLGVCIDEKLMYNLTNSYLQREPIVDDFDRFKDSHYLQLEPRSSLRAKGLIAGTGIIDLDYKDEIMIILHNPITYSWNENFEDGTVDYITHLHNGAEGTNIYKIKKGDKIAQILLKEHKTYLMGVDTEDERVGGLGSTGK